jgi:hypothetical protein
MMKEVERMSRMTNEEREQLQAIQEGLTGAREMDQAWMDSAIAMLKKNPDFYKGLVKGKGAMMGGVTDEQIEGFIDAAAAMDATTLRWILMSLKYLSSWGKPLSDFYAALDKNTFGTAKYILLGLAAIIMYYSAVFWIGVARWVIYKLMLLFGFASATPEAVSSAAASAASSTATEFAAGSSAAAVGAAAGAGAAVGAATEAAKVAAASASGGAAATAGNAKTAADKGKKAAGDVDAEFEF